MGETMQDVPEPLRSLLNRCFGSSSTDKRSNDEGLGAYARDRTPSPNDSAVSKLVKLRESCTCNKCVDPTDHQRLFVWAEIPYNIYISKCYIDSDGKFVVTWRNDIGDCSRHVSHYTKAQIERLNDEHPPLVAEFGQRPKRLWSAAIFDVSENTVSYQEYMNDDDVLARLLHLVARDGLAFIDGIPGQADSVNKMAERVGPIRTTFYGETWDVKSMPEATNVAYTSRYLGFHMDMLYVREPPGLQFLHCIENTCTGGESRFADTFSAADRLISQEGEAAFSTLESMKVTYRYWRPGTSTSAVKPIFDTVSRETKPPNNFVNGGHRHLINKLHRVYWSPPFVGRALTSSTEDETISELQASRSFHQILEDEFSFIKTKIPAGTCAVFDNFRVVHAREAFDLNSGNRWLRVAYVDDSDFQSRALTLQDRMPVNDVGITW